MIISMVVEILRIGAVGGAVISLLTITGAFDKTNVVKAKIFTR